MQSVLLDAAGHRRFAGDDARLPPRPSTTQQGRAVPSQSTDSRRDRRGHAHH
jgi:hypothetical protein